jgi:hypothetical protein
MRAAGDHLLECFHVRYPDRLALGSKFKPQNTKREGAQVGVDKV